MNFVARVAIASSCAAVAMGVSASALAASGDQMCAVKIDRSQASGVYDVTKVVADDGDCVCYVYTGPETQGQGIEGQIASLRQSKTCSDAKVSRVSKSAAGANGSDWAALGAAAAFGGLLKVASDNTNDEDSPASP